MFVCLSQRWNALNTSTEEYEAEGTCRDARHPQINSPDRCLVPASHLCLHLVPAGQMHLWNPDEPSTPRGSVGPLSTFSEERLREACSELEIPWDGYVGHSELLALCEHLGLEVGDVKPII